MPARCRRLLGFRSDDARSRLLRSGYVSSSPDEVTIRTRVVIFVDGTAWSRGMLHHPDPNAPLRWVVAGDHAASTRAPRVGDIYRASYSPAVAKPFECGRNSGFEMLYCCDGLYIYSATVIPDPNGYFQAQLTTAYCNGGSCEYYELVSCR